MKKLVFIIFVWLLGSISLNAGSVVERLYEGNSNAKITILAYESLTCSHCANFHKDVYPELKKTLLIKVL